MTTFSGQSCVLGTADNCGLLREECGALGFVLTRMGQEMGSIWLLRFFGLARRSGGVLAGSAARRTWFATTALANGNRAYAGCAAKLPIFLADGIRS